MIRRGRPNRWSPRTQAARYWAPRRDVGAEAAGRSGGRRIRSDPDDARAEAVLALSGGRQAAQTFLELPAKQRCRLIRCDGRGLARETAQGLLHRIISTTPVTFRVGGNQGTFIVKLEPLHRARPSL